MSLRWAVRFVSADRYYVLSEDGKQRDADLLADGNGPDAEVVKVRIEFIRRPRRRSSRRNNSGE
jgi:hypothetical protein